MFKWDYYSLITVVLFIHNIHHINSAHLGLAEIVVNRSSLSITSFHLNPTHKYSEWVDKNLGSRSIFYSGERDNEFPLDKEKANRRFQKFSQHFSLPPYALWPECSVEILGFVKSNVMSPFMKDYGNPFVGEGSMLLNGQKWDCYYRAQRRASSVLDYWPVFIYCPSPPIVPESRIPVCIELRNDDIANVQTKNKVQLTLNSNPVSSNSMTVHFALRDIKQFYYSHKNTIAFCLAIPYTTDLADEKSTNGAMIFESVRYYSNLGANVIVYDRGGKNKNYIFESEYRKAQMNGNSNDFLNVVYFDYTMLEILQPDKYKNNEEGDSTHLKTGQGVIGIGDQDKMLTTTNCRFTAQALFGIETTIVSDFDEFLYCPAAGINMESYLAHHLKHQKINSKADQIMLYQRTVSNTTESPSQCLLDVVKRGASHETIFDCWSGYKFHVAGHSVKSIHLNLGCPFTYYHEACTNGGGYDCLCEMGDIGDCQFVHLQTIDKPYHEPIRQYKLEEVRSTKSELKHIATESKSGNERRKLFFNAKDIQYVS